MGIPVRVDSPGVGKNLQSHVGTGDVIFTLKDPVSFNAFRLYLNPLNLIDYFIRRKGPLSGVSGFDGLGNIRVMLSSVFDVASSFYQIQSHIDDHVNVLSRAKREVPLNILNTSYSTQSINNVQLPEDIHRLFLGNPNAISRGNYNIW